MISRITNPLFKLQFDYTNAIERQRARALLTITWFAVPIWAMLYFFSVLPLVQSGAIPSTGWIMISMTLVPAPLLFIFLTLQRGQWVIASWLFVASLLALNVPVGLFTYLDVLQLTPLLALVAAGVLLNRRGLLIVTVICVLSMIMTSLNQTNYTDFVRFIPADGTLFEFILLTGMVLLVALFLFAFNGTPERVAADASRTARHWQALNTMTTMPFVRDEDAIETALSLAQDPLGYDIVQVFLKEERQQFARRYRLTLSANSPLVADTALGTASRLTSVEIPPNLVVDNVLRVGTTIRLTARDMRSQEHFISPAQMSLSIAMMYEGVRFGVFDVQSRGVIPIDADHIAVLEGLVAQLSRTLWQLRRVRALEADFHEQESATNRLRSQLSELQRRTEGSATSGWDRYLRALGVTGFGYDMNQEGALGQGMIAANDLPPVIRATLERGDVYIERQQEKQIVSAPITYRNQMLGAMNFTIPLNRSIGSNELEMVKTVSQRLGIALENNRLFEQSQSQAQRERKASEIGGLLLSATDIEQVLALAADAFNEALGATHTRVSLQPEHIFQDQAERGGQS